MESYTVSVEMQEIEKYFPVVTLIIMNSTCMSLARTQFSPWMNFQNAIIQIEAVLQKGGPCVIGPFHTLEWRGIKIFFKKILTRQEAE